MAKTNEIPTFIVGHVNKDGAIAGPKVMDSGGESQRIRLATQTASQLVNVPYILDEPSIDSTQRDNVRLINSPGYARDLSNMPGQGGAR